MRGNIGINLILKIRSDQIGSLPSSRQCLHWLNPEIGSVRSDRIIQQYLNKQNVYERKGAEEVDRWEIARQLVHTAEQGFWLHTMRCENGYKYENLHLTFRRSLISTPYVSVRYLLWATSFQIYVCRVVDREQTNLWNVEYPMKMAVHFDLPETRFHPHNHFVFRTWIHQCYKEPTQRHMASTTVSR